MYYKVIYNGRIIDVLDKIVYLRYQNKYDRMLLCKESEAQAILSSNGKYVWHVDCLCDIPVDGYDTVQLENIDRYEYDRLKVFNCEDPIEIIDRFVCLFVNKETSCLVESLKRLYVNGEIDRESVIEFCNKNEIGENIISYILNEDK